MEWSPHSWRVNLSHSRTAQALLSIGRPRPLTSNPPPANLSAPLVEKRLAKSRWPGPVMLTAHDPAVVNAGWHWASRARQTSTSGGRTRQAQKDVAGDPPPPPPPPPVGTIVTPLGDAPPPPRKPPGTHSPARRAPPLSR